jgi:two-component system, cell cycle response regulator
MRRDVTSRHGSGRRGRDSEVRPLDVSQRRSLGILAAVTTDGSLQGTRVLIAHRSDAARHALRDVLEPLGCDVAEAATREDTIAVAGAHATDVLLLHAGLAGAVADVKRDPDLFRIALVLVGLPPDARDTLHLLDHGVHDLLREDAPPAEIVARVRAARRAQEMQDQLLSREHELEQLAYRDELTGLANRRFAMRQLHAEISRVRRHQLDLAVVILDADRFKTLNDRHGHLAGDAVLRGLGERLRGRLREEDVVARFGCEEFLVILPDTGAEGAAAVAEDLRAAVAAEPFPIGRIALRLTVSAGYAVWEGEELERLIGRADRGLYAAKEAGRDGVRPGPAATQAH